MKKFLTLILALALTASLAACGNSNTPASSSGSASSGSAAGSGDASFTTAVDGVLSMATEATFPPYEYYDGDTIVGIDVEIAQAIADKLGLELQVTDIAFDSIIPGVQTGKYDIGLAGMTVTDERLEQVNFTDSYATGIQVVIVKEGGKVSSVDDLFAEGANNVVGTQTGTTFRFKGKGMPYVGYKNRGDQLVTVVVETPTRLTREQKELLRRFDESAEGANAKKKSFAEKMKKLFE